MRAKHLKTRLEMSLKTMDPVMIWGPPGIGKSNIAKQVCDENGLQFIDMRLVDRDPTDLRGIPFPVDGKTEYLQPSELPTEGEGVLFLDEIVQAPMATMNVASQLILDRRIGDYVLPPGWRVWAAGNEIGHRAGANKMPTHLENRFDHVYLEVHNPDWHEWAMENGIAPEVTAFLKFRPELLQNFDAQCKEHAQGTPRSWERCSNFIKAEPPPEIEFESITGIVGEGPATEFSSFLEMMRELTNPEDILRDPENAPTPTTSSAMYATMGAVAALATAKNSMAVFTYAKRLPNEYTVMLMREAEARDPAISGTKAFRLFAEGYLEMFL